MILHDASTNADYFYAQDGLGTIRGIYDTSSAMVNNYDYEGFGTNYGAATETIYNRFRYTGREIDEKTYTANSESLYYYHARTYDSTIGSFTSRDLIPARNLYSYCSSNPTNYIDPLGLGKWMFVDVWSWYSSWDHERQIHSSKALFDSTRFEDSIWGLFWWHEEGDCCGYAVQHERQKSTHKVCIMQK